tara:strand:+ start:1018 stop:1215 length:198 start_codon:yes stop_codon:yes gene_type:complete
MYLGSKIFNGTVVFGKIIKFDNGKIGILFGNSKSFFISINLILLNYVVIPILYYGHRNWQEIYTK